MSAIATGCSVSSDLLIRLAAMVLYGDFWSFWKTLRSEGVQTDPPYSYSGYVMLMAIGLLMDRGWTPVIDLSSPEATSIDDAEIGTVLCCQERDANEGLSFLRSLALSDAELAAFQKEYWGEEWDQAVPALREAIAYIEKTLALLPKHGDWALLFIG